MKDTYLELSLASPSSPLGLPIPLPQPSPLLDHLRVIKKAGEDPAVRGMALNLSRFSGGREEIWELRSALAAFKERGKKIAAFIDNADLDTYLLASVADTIVMDEMGGLTLLGYAYGRGYFQGALEKAGIGARELRYLDYKSALEGFTRDSLSETDKEQYGAYLDDIFRLTKETLMKARSWSEEDFDAILNREFLFSAKAALERGLVDRVGREKAFAQAVEDLEGRPVDWFLSCGPSCMLAGAGSKGYTVPSRYKGAWFTPEIAVIQAHGETSLDRGMGARSLARTIRETAGNPKVKALVIRINSPGGDAEAADYVAEAIRDAGKAIPVVVSMGSVAASGGYWAAVYAGHIVASPYTLTGSIGVIGSWFYDKGIYDKLGLSVDTLTKGEHADLFTGFLIPRRDLSAEEEERYRQYMMDLYGLFVAKVAEGRKMDAAAVEAAAQGRVYSGLEAQRLGLVDSIGGFAEALDKAGELAGLGGKKRPVVREYPKPAFWDSLLEMLPGAARAGQAAAFWEHIRYRLSRNGQAVPVMSVMPLLEYSPPLRLW